MHIKDNNNSPHGKFHRFLFPFSSKFPDLNFAPYVLYMKPVRDTNSEPELPVVTVSFSQETEGSQSPFRRRAVRQRGYGLWLLIFKMANNKVDLGQIRSEEMVYSRFIKSPLS